MRKTSSFIVGGLAIVAVGAAIWSGGGFLWTKLLEMHGIHKTARARPGAPAPAWPETRAGAIGRDWVEAYCAGPEAMRKLRDQTHDPAVPWQHTEEERDASYRALHERFGDLKLATVVSSTPGELEVVLSASDGSEQNFIFEVEKDPPFKLLAVKMREAHHFM